MENKLANELVDAVNAKNPELMLEKYNVVAKALTKLDKQSEDYGFESAVNYSELAIASLKYKAFNNMNDSAQKEGEKTFEMLVSLVNLGEYTQEERNKLVDLEGEIQKIIKPLKKQKNLVVPREDTSCVLCKKRPANNTGAHMVPNFLTAPTFSWNGKGKRFNEALNHDFLNKAEKNCTFYGQQVPAWRWAQGEGKTEVTEEDIDNNVNQIEYDNEFCSVCEKRFGILETAYAQYYNGQKKNINPRLSYLFWLSVLWRMSMGSMSIFMDMHDELPLRELLNDNILSSEKEIIESDSDLGNWKYAIFRADGLRDDGDKGILGYRKECSPYVVMYNDLVMVFFHDSPSDEELTIGPITVDRNFLNDWHSQEKTVKIDRRHFWNVRDWINETSYDFYDPAREGALLAIREKEREEGRTLDKYKKIGIDVARLSTPPKRKLYRLRKLDRIYAAWVRLKEAKEKGEDYDPLKDEQLFITEQDFSKYYHDLAIFSKSGQCDRIEEFPFYEDARKAIPDNKEWETTEEVEDPDPDHTKATANFLSKLKPKDLKRWFSDGDSQEPYVNPYKHIGRNDPCPCGSGKKFKNCHGRNL
jgi:hypothetical protein